MNHFSAPLHLSQKRIDFGLFKIDIINYIESFFKIEHIETKRDDYIRKSEYRILNTDIDMIIASLLKQQVIACLFLITKDPCLILLPLKHTV